MRTFLVVGTAVVERTLRHPDFTKAETFDLKVPITPEHGTRLLGKLKNGVVVYVSPFVPKDTEAPLGVDR